MVEADGSIIVQLDKALYECVRTKLEKDGFIANPYDGVQITIVVHVDDLLITSASVTNLASFEQYLKSIYPQISVHREAILDYIGITFNFTVQGKVSITMENCVSDILSDCSKSNIGSHNVQKVSPAETYFHT